MTQWRNILTSFNELVFTLICCWYADIKYILSVVNIARFVNVFLQKCYDFKVSPNSTLGRAFKRVFRVVNISFHVHRMWRALKVVTLSSLVYETDNFGAGATGVAGPSSPVAKTVRGQQVALFLQELHFESRALFIWNEIENYFQAIQHKFESEIPIRNVTKISTFMKKV